MPYIILKNPFIRHYAGSVFDLEENFQRSSWDMNELLYERMPAQRNYLLPDGGKGFAVELSISDTVLCPPSVLEGVDLTIGPCRITSVKTQLSNGENAPIEWQLSMEKTSLFDIDIYEKQEVKIELPPSSPSPQSVEIIERKGNKILKSINSSNYELSIDFKDFSNGFYEIRIHCKNNILHIITLIKCFPLVITFDPRTGKYTTMKTIW